MNRRRFLQIAMAGSVTAGFAGETMAKGLYFPTKVDQSLFEGMNRVKNAKEKTPLEMGHAPVITAPNAVTAGDPFTVEVTVGEKLHPMGPTHWIEYIELYIGNEPAGRVELQSSGYMKPKVTFNVVLPRNAAPEGKVSLVARQHCNLHGLWEGVLDIAVR